MGGGGTTPVSLNDTVLRDNICTSPRHRGERRTRVSNVIHMVRGDSRVPPHLSGSLSLCVETLLWPPGPTRGDGFN